MTLVKTCPEVNEFLDPNPFFSIKIRVNTSETYSHPIKFSTDLQIFETIFLNIILTVNCSFMETFLV